MIDAQTNVHAVVAGPARRRSGGIEITARRPSRNWSQTIRRATAGTFLS
jgi:hypothetical protein